MRAWGAALLLAWRMLRRDLRAGELHLLGLALLIAVASLSSVSFLADRVGRSLEREASQLLGGDLLLSADHPWPARFLARAEQHGLASAHSVLITSMVAGGEQMVLAGVKAVDDNYPLRGALRITAAAGEADHEAQAMPAADEIWLDERLAGELGVAPGARVQLGESEFRVAALLTFEADRGSNIFSLLPRAVFNRSALEATALMGEGSRASYRLHVAGEAAAVAAYERWASAELGRGERIETVANARPEVRAALDQAQRYLRLAAMLAVVLAAVAVGLCAHRFMRRHVDGCAVMRALGAGRGQLLAVMLGEFLLFGLIVSALGSLLGLLVQAALAQGLVALLETRLPPPSWWPLAQGLLVGLVLLIGFVLPQLLRLSRVSTLGVLRRELQLFESHSLLAWGLGALVLALLLLWVAGDLRLGLMLVPAFALALALFVLAAWLVSGLLLRLLRWSGVGRGHGWQQGLAALGRRRAASVLQIAALAVGLSSLLLLALLRGDLLAHWQRLAPPDAPNHFIVNIQPEQQAAIRTAFAEAGLTPPAIDPMVRARLSRINGRAVSAQDYEDERSQRLIEREFNLSWAEALPPGNELVSGQWHGADTTPQFSVEEELAQRFGLVLGDELGFDIGGQLVSARLTSLRRLDWNSMRVNFFVIAAPGMLEQFPASLITSFHLPPEETGFGSRLVVAFPNLTLIDVTALLAQLERMAGRLMLIVQGVFIFALLAGVLVMLAALQASEDERQQEIAILRTLGAGDGVLRQALLSEMAALGLLAGVLATLAASLIARWLASTLFELPYLPALWPLLLAVALAVLGVVLAGWLNVRRLLRRSPLLLLRHVV